MKSTTPTIEPEEPKSCCGCNMKTFSILLSMWSLLYGIRIFLSMSADALIYGKFCPIMHGTLSIIATVIYLGVGFTDNPMWSKAARVIEYVYTVRSVWIIGYLIWLLNSTEMLKTTVQNVYDHNKPTFTAAAEDVKFDDFYLTQVVVMKYAIFEYSLCIILYIYLSIKFTENAEYLEKKAEKESAVIIDF